jgi:hypothetical protein
MNRITERFNRLKCMGSLLRWTYFYIVATGWRHMVAVVSMQRYVVHGQRLGRHSHLEVATVSRTCTLPPSIRDTNVL